MGKPIQLTYPTVDTMAKRIADLGIGCGTFKKDMKSAFRQLSGDLFDLSLMIYSWQGKYYVDLAVAMGLRSAPSACQRVTNAITAIHCSKGYWLVNYIDDFISAERWKNVWNSYRDLGNLFQEIGAKEAPDKASPLDTQVNCLGVLMDTILMVMKVLPERIQELMNLLQTWRHKETTNRRQLESLLGKLQFISNCVRQGRIFVSRLLGFLKSMNDRQRWYRIPDEVRQDLRWWYLYLPTFNGQGILWYTDVEQIDTLLTMDSSLKGIGGVTKTHFFRA